MAAGETSLLKIDLAKKFDQAFSLEIKCDLPVGQCTGLYGPSGAGKTTLLRLLAGFDRPDRGCIANDGLVWFDKGKKIHLKAQARNVALVFQGDDLFTHMSVEKNLLFAAKKPIENIIKRFELTALLNRKPTELSGGQRQRVSLARALCSQPSVLLLDEPFSALDGRARQYLQGQFKEMQADLNLTTVVVSHNISELYNLSRTLLLIENGRIIGQDNVAQIINQNSISGKFKFTGKIIEIQKADLLYVVTLEVQNQLTRILVARASAEKLSVGDYALISAKAFNPVLTKIGS